MPAYEAQAYLFHNSDAMAISFYDRILKPITYACISNVQSKLVVLIPIYIRTLTVLAINNTLRNVLYSQHYVPIYAHMHMSYLYASIYTSIVMIIIILSVCMVGVALIFHTIIL